MANTRSRTPIPPHHRPDYGSSPESVGADRSKAHVAGRRPWKHMADTYIWVEHHCAPLDPRRRKTEKWVLEQQVLHPPPVFDGYSRAWMQEEEAAKRFIARESERARMVQEELKRIEERIRHRRETERRRVAAERARFSAEKDKTDAVVREAWRRYEQGWQEIQILAKPTEITFSTIPWPLATRPTSCEDITLKDIKDFIMSPHALENLSAKERIRKAQLRWHPDRFRRVLQRVVVDKELVEEGAGIVARCLNELMAEL